MRTSCRVMGSSVACSPATRRGNGKPGTPWQERCRASRMVSSLRIGSARPWRTGCGSRRRSRSWAAARRSPLAAARPGRRVAHDAGGRADRAHQHAAVDRARSRGMVPFDGPRDRRVTEDGDARRWVIRHGRAPVDNVDDRPSRTPPVALHELRLQPAVRLLLRALLAGRAAARARPRRACGASPAKRRARRRRDLRDGRRAVPAPRHRRDPARLRARGADHGADQRDALRGARRAALALAAARPGDAPDQPRQPDARACTTAIAAPGTWARAWRGIETARAEGFRVRLAATVSPMPRTSALPAFPRRPARRRARTA